MDITTIIAKVLGAILLLLSLVSIPAGRIVLRQMRDLFNSMLSWEPTDNLNEKLEFWFEQAMKFPNIAVSIIHAEIFRAFKGLSAGRKVYYQGLEMESLETDNLYNRIIHAMRLTIFRWRVVPFIVGIGLILSGSLWWILLLPIAWMVTFYPFCQVGPCAFLLAIVSGWIYGGLIFSHLSSTSKLWYCASHAIGIVFVVMVLVILELILWFPYRPWTYSSSIDAKSCAPVPWERGFEKQVGQNR